MDEDNHTHIHISARCHILLLLPSSKAWEGGGKHTTTRGDVQSLFCRSVCAWYTLLLGLAFSIDGFSILPFLPFLLFPVPVGEKRCLLSGVVSGFDSNYHTRDWAADAPADRFTTFITFFCLG